MARYYEINETDARMAHEANSMREFKAGSETEGYRAQVDEAYRMAEEQAERFPELAEKAYALADRFARKYAEWLNEGYRIDAMCPSILVSGGGNFPVRKKERQNARRSSHMERYEKVMGIKRRIASIGTGGIQAGDPNALEKLEAKAKRLENRQDIMEVTEDKPRETEEKPKPSPLDDYKFHVDTGGAIVCSNDAYELLDALRDMHWL